MIVISDIVKKTWYFDEEENLPAFWIDLKIGFREDGKLPVFFNDMSFGYSLKLNNKIISEMSYPVAIGINYNETDQEYLERFGINNIVPGKTYLLYVWSKNNGEFWSDSYLISIPAIPQPYPSWTLNEDTGTWISPIPYPEDANSYEWDEQSQSWMLREID